MEEVYQEEYAEINDRVGVEYSEQGGITESGESSRANSSERAANLMDNPMLAMLINEMRAQNARLEQRLAENTNSLEQRLAENTSSMEDRIEQKLIENIGNLEQKLIENSNSIESMQQRMGENFSTLENRLREDLSENIETIKKDLFDNVGCLENRLRESIESRVKENSEIIESMLQDHIESKKNLEGELDRIVNIELREVHGKVGRLGEVVQAMDTKFDKIEHSVIQALEQLELNAQSKTTSINPATTSENDHVLDDKRVENNIQVPEQNSFRNVNIGMTDLALPTFGNNGGQNPIKFIRDLENYLEIKSVPEGMKPMVVRNCLTDNAASWYEMLNTEGTTYGEFKRKFIDHFWDRTRQEEVRSKLNQGKFNPRGHLKMADYFIQMGQLAKLLEPPISTSDMINQIANHFATDIRSAIIVSKPRNCEEMVSLLKKLQGNQGATQQVARELGPGRNQPRAEVNFISHGVGHGKCKMDIKIKCKMDTRIREPENLHLGNLIM